VNSFQNDQLMNFGASFQIKVNFVEYFSVKNICSRLKENHKKQRPGMTSTKYACLKL